MHVFAKKKKKSGTTSNSLIKVISGPGLSCDIVHCAWSVALVHGHKNFLVLFCEVNYLGFTLFCEVNYLGFTNLDKTSTYLKSDKIQYTHQPGKNRPRPKGRHTIIAVRYNERNNRTCFAFSKPLCKKKKKKNCRDDPRFVFDFSLYYPVRNFILKYQYSSSPIYKSYTSFSVGRWLRFFDVLAYRSSVQSIITP